MITSPKLNTNQARHVTAYLHLLAEELTIERGFLPAGPAGDPRRAAVDHVHACINDMLTSLRLDAPRQPEPGRRLWALGETWLTRIEDLRARGLKPYGPVSPGLDDVLNPSIDKLAKSLKVLSSVAEAR